MSRPLKPRNLLWLCIVTGGIILMPDARGGDAYLPRIGPAPLRIATAKRISAPKPVFFPVPEPAPETKPSEPPIPVSTNSTEITKPIMEKAPPLEMNPAKTVEETNLTFPADNLLNTTPNMLIDYFKPLPGVTNSGVSIVLPADVNFMPPIPKESSRATYKIE